MHVQSINNARNVYPVSNEYSAVFVLRETSLTG